MWKKHFQLNFDKKHLKIITLLILLDIVATMLWYSFSSVKEWNPIMDSILEVSLISFVIAKLSISFFTIHILSKYISKKISQIGIGIVLATYSIVTILHYFVFLFLLSNF